MPIGNEAEALANTVENSGETEHNERVERTSERPERASRIDDRQNRLDGRNRTRDLRSTLKDAFKTVAKAEKDEDKPANGGKAPETAEKPKDRGAEGASSSEKPIPTTAKAGETAPDPALQTQEKTAAPAALSKDVKAIWDTLPPTVQAEFVRREADTQKGVDQLKAKYKPIEDAFAPVRGQLQQLGKTEAEAAKQLIEWQAALANPRTQAQAFRALAQAHGFDLSTINAPQGGSVAQTNQNPDPTQAFRPLLDPLMQKVSTLESQLQQRDMDRVQNEIAMMSKDKPHFEKVRVAMGHMINAGLISGNSPQEVFDKAYASACRADPEVFEAIQTEQTEKREAEAKAKAEADAKKKADDAEANRKKHADEVAKARKAAVTPRSGTPTGMAISKEARGKPVRATIVEAMQSARGQI